MRLNEVMDEIGLVVAQLVKLEAFAWPVADLPGRSVIVSYPESVDFDQTYGRGEDTITDLPVSVLIGEPTERTTRDEAAKWADGDGVTSVKRTLEDHAWQSCDDVQVVRAEFDVMPVGGIPWLAVTFSCNITGSGKD